MKSQRSSRGPGKVISDSPKIKTKHHFAVASILLNLIAIVVLGAAYYYINLHEMYPAYITQIYWAINVLISYNIIVGSARSLWLPLLSVIVALLGIIANSSPESLTLFANLTSAQCWQLAALGIVGFFIHFSLK